MDFALALAFPFAAALALALALAFAAALAFAEADPVALFLAFTLSRPQQAFWGIVTMTVAVRGISSSPRFQPIESQFSFFNAAFSSSSGVQ